MVIAAEHHQYEDGNEISFEVIDVMMHENYDQSTLDNDIALLKIKGKFPCDNDHIKPVTPLIDVIKIFEGERNNAMV